MVHPGSQAMFRATEVRAWLSTARSVVDWAAPPTVPEGARKPQRGGPVAYAAPDAIRRMDAMKLPLPRTAWPSSTRSIRKGTRVRPLHSSRTLAAASRARCEDVDHMHHNPVNPADHMEVRSHRGAVRTLTPRNGQMVGDVRDCDVIVVDDMIDTATRAIAAARVLK